MFSKDPGPLRFFFPLPAVFFSRRSEPIWNQNAPASGLRFFGRFPLSPGSGRTRPLGKNVRWVGGRDPTFAPGVFFFVFFFFFGFFVSEVAPSLVFFFVCAGACPSFWRSQKNFVALQGQKATTLVALNLLLFEIAPEGISLQCWRFFLGGSRCGLQCVRCLANHLFEFFEFFTEGPPPPVLVLLFRGGFFKGRAPGPNSEQRKKEGKTSPEPCRVGSRDFVVKTSRTHAGRP